MLFENDPQIKATKTILLGRVGSHAYGTNNADSDEDFMAVCIAPLEHYFGLDWWPDEKNSGAIVRKYQKDGYDYQGYELRKFIQLCVAFNPNVIPLLFLRDQDYISIHPAGKFLIDNRHLFWSRRAYHAFAAYAESQLKKVFSGNTGTLGTKRKELVAKYGYDVDFAYHTIRLLRMCVEFLKDRTMQVYRPDAAELLEIRNGKWTIKEFTEEAHRLLETAKALPSNLPDEVDMRKINDLTMAILSNFARARN